MFRLLSKLNQLTKDNSASSTPSYFSFSPTRRAVGMNDSSQLAGNHSEQKQKEHEPLHGASAVQQFSRIIHDNGQA